MVEQTRRKIAPQAVDVDKDDNIAGGGSGFDGR